MPILLDNILPRVGRAVDAFSAWVSGEGEATAFLCGLLHSRCIFCTVADIWV